MPVSLREVSFGTLSASFNAGNIQGVRWLYVITSRLDSQLHTESPASCRHGCDSQHLKSCGNLNFELLACRWPSQAAWWMYTAANSEIYSNVWENELPAHRTQRAFLSMPAVRCTANMTSHPARSWGRAKRGRNVFPDRRRQIWTFCKTIIFWSEQKHAFH